MQVWLERPAKDGRQAVFSCIQMKTDFVLLSNKYLQSSFSLSFSLRFTHRELPSFLIAICYLSATILPHLLCVHSTWVLMKTDTDCILPYSLLGLLKPILSKVISFYLQYSSCLCILLSSISTH